MTPFIGFLAGAIIGLLLAAVLLEWSDSRERDRRDAEDYAEFDEWLRARDVTGRVSR